MGLNDRPVAGACPPPPTCLAGPQGALGSFPAVGIACGHLPRGPLGQRSPEAAKKVGGQAHTDAPRQSLGQPDSLRSPAWWTLSASPSSFMLFLGCGSFAAFFLLST